MELHESEKQTQEQPPHKKRSRWLIISIVINTLFIVVAIGVASGAVVLHQSDTNPNFCASCHIMQPNVESYQTSNHLDHIHSEAGVQCKDCHSDYSIPDEIASGVNFITGDYKLDDNDLLVKREFGDEICTQCHGSLESVYQQTDFLYYNPHTSAMGYFSCTTCHLSHEDQFDQCNVCHYAEQRMIGDTTPRDGQIGEDIPYIPW